ncbi:MAG: aminoglycoside phosphotransferase family protein [Actinomycetota bacterium]
MTDPGIPPLAELLGEAVPGPIRAVVEAGGGRVDDCYPVQVTWWPGVSVTVRYRASVTGGELAGTQDLVGVAGRITPGAAIVEVEGEQVGVWRVPHDPALPGLAPALDDRRARELLVDLGAEDAPVRTRLRAYRPGRRAVVSVEGPVHGVYLKLVRPKKVEQLHSDHKLLPAGLPVPHSLGYSRELGLMALQAMPGRTLRDVLEDPNDPLPEASSVAELPLSLPAPPAGRLRPSIIERVPALGEMLRRIVPECSDAIDQFLVRLGEEDVDDLAPVHGDYYESQILVEDGSVVGLLDVDTYGLGRRGDDPGVMLGHLALWQTMSSQPERVRDFARSLLAIWDRLYDPSDIRRRAAATLFTLASGPFRVQTADWPGATADRIALAHRWLESAGRAG